MVKCGIALSIYYDSIPYSIILMVLIFNDDYNASKITTV